MKILLAASMALLLTGASFAQTDGTADASSRGGSDAANYLAGPNIQDFYTDETMMVMKSEAEIKAAMDAMSDEDKANLANACEANQDAKHEQLCLSMRTN